MYGCGPDASGAESYMSDDPEVTRLASALCPEVEEVIGHQELGGWEMLLQFLFLFEPKVPLPSDLVKHRADWVRGCECLT